MMDCTTTHWFPSPGEEGLMGFYGKSKSSQTETTHPALRLKAEMDKDAVIGLLGRDHRSTTRGPLEYWLYSDDRYDIEIIFVPFNGNAVPDPGQRLAASGLGLRVPGGFKPRDYAGRLDRAAACVVARGLTAVLGCYLYIRASGQADHDEGCRVAAGGKVHLVALRRQLTSQYVRHVPRHDFLGHLPAPPEPYRRPVFGS